MVDELTDAELRELLARDEGQFLEFKSLWDLEGGRRKVLDRRIVRDWIAEYVAAFANADGGTIILGADDDGTPSGHGYPEEAVRDFLAVPTRRLRPPVRVRSERTRLDAAELIVMHVDRHAEAVMVEAGGFPYRVGDQLQSLPQEVINGLKQSYQRVGYEQRIRSDATIEDLDLDLARAFFARCGRAGRPV